VTVAETQPSEQEVRELVAAVVAAVGTEDLGATGTADLTEPPAGSPVDEDGVVVPPPTANPRLADIAIGGDHGGFHLKQRIVAELQEKGFTVNDCGTETPHAVDYPDYAHSVARLVAGGQCRWGIVVDGAGIGSAITANKVPGIRAATCWDVSSAKNAREHNHSNVLALGAGLLGESLVLQIIQTWLQTPWSGGRHARRVGKIAEIERRYLKDAVR
jgi:ribose 5-phosphate isomerase B